MSKLNNRYWIHNSVIPVFEWDQKYYKVIRYGCLAIEADVYTKI